MNIPRIEIQQEFARINIESTPPLLEIEQKRADLEIKQPRGELQIERRDVRVEIDNYPFRHDLGYKNFTDFNKGVARRAEETVKQVAACYARQGDRLMRINNKANKRGEALIQNIRENTTPEKREVGLQWVRGPEFNVIPEKTDTRYFPRRPEIESKPNFPEYKFTRGGVRISMASYGKIEISLKGQFFNRSI